MRYLATFFFLLAGFVHLWAQNVPAPWQFTYIGDAPTAPGSANFEAETWTLQGGGFDIWAESDDFHFLYQEVCGDLDLTVRIAQQGETGNWAKTGLMVRASLEAGAVHGMMLLFPASNGTGVGMQYRSQKDALTQAGEFLGGRTAPYWLRIVREGNTLHGYHSPDSITWTLAGTQSLPLGSSVLAGIAVTSFNPDTTCEVVATDLTLNLSTSSGSLQFLEAEQAIALPSFSTLETAIDASAGRLLVLPTQSPQLTAPVDIWRYPFELCGNGDYHVWLRARSLDNASNALWVQLDNNPWIRWDSLTHSSDWQWVLSPADNGQTAFPLSIGSHELRLAYATGNVALDRILITDSLGFVPQGFDFSPIYAETLYLSPDGNDSLAGTSPAEAWRSLDRLNQSFSGLLPGASVRFERGRTYSGILSPTRDGLSGAPITFGAYGEGPAPVISGAVLLADWEPVSGQLYRSAVAQAPTELWVDGKWLARAREPDAGFWHMSEVLGDRGFVSDSLITQADGYWEGATARFRTNDWTWEHRKVVSHRNDTLLFEGTTDYELKRNWGFWLDGKRSFLDRPGEWAYEDGYVYLWLPDGSDPQARTVEGAVHPYGFYLANNVSHLRIEDLHLSKQQANGIQISGTGSKSIDIVGCEFSHIGEVAIEWFGSHHQVDSCSFHDLLGQGVFGFGNDSVRVTHSQFRRIGLQYGMGRSGQHQQVGVYLDNATAAYIGYNRFDSTGYAAIGCYCAQSLVERNIIHDALLTLDDGSGLYCWGLSSVNTTFRQNIVSRVRGNRIGTEDTDSVAPGSIANAIYIDNLSTFITVEENTVVESKTGLLTNANTQHTTFRNNVAYNNGTQLVFADWQLSTPIRDCVTENNVLVGVAPRQTPVWVIANRPDDLGSFSNNYYFEPYREVARFPSGLSYEAWMERVDEPDAKLSFFVLEEGEDDPSLLLINESDTTQFYAFEEDYLTVDSQVVRDVTLAPFRSVVLFRAEGLKARIFPTDTTQIPPLPPVDTVVGRTIFPNPLPAGEMLQVESEEEVDGYELLDLAGRTLRREAFEPQSILSIDLAGLSAGVYLLVLHVDGSDSHLYKIIIQ